MEAQKDYERACKELDAKNQRRIHCGDDRGENADANPQGSTLRATEDAEDQVVVRGHKKPTIVLPVTAEEVIDYIDPDPNEPPEAFVARQISREIDREVLKDLWELVQNKELEENEDVNDQ